MKNLKKLTLNARQLSHAEMKNVRGANSRSSTCTATCRNGYTISVTCDLGCGASDYNSVSGMYGNVYCVNEKGNQVEFMICVH